MGFSVVKDPKEAIKFWLDALSHQHVNQKNIILLNKCLESELNHYINPNPSTLTSLDDIGRFHLSSKITE